MNEVNATYSQPCQYPWKEWHNLDTGHVAEAPSGRGTTPKTARKDSIGL